MGEKPTNGGTFFRFLNHRFAFQQGAEKSWRDPVLALFRQKMINDIEQFPHGNPNAQFLMDFPTQRVCQGFPKLNRTTGSFPQPALILGVGAALGQKKPPFGIDNQCADANSNIINASFHQLSVSCSC